MVDKPKPGSPEHELAMLEKYRAQQQPRDESLTISHREVEGFNGKLQIGINSLVEGPEPTLSAAAADPAQITAIERDIDRLREELAETIEELDPETGQRALRFVGHERRMRELQLHNLETNVLPGQLQLQAMARAQLAQEPTLEQKLQAEREHKQAIHERAVQIADEQEAVDEAVRIVATRDNTRGVK